MSRPPLGLPTRFAFANQQRQSSGAGAAIYPALCPIDSRGIDAPAARVPALAADGGRCYMHWHTY